MKVYIAADIEGVTGICDWGEANRNNAEYQEFREQMTKEVVAACDGAKEAGASEVLVKDSHSSARNIIISKLPKYAKIVRGWSFDPFLMVQEISDMFDAAIMIGMHSAAGSNKNPLAHTVTLKFSYVKVNGKLFSEFHLYSYAAALKGVPVVFVSGDQGLCDEAVLLNKDIKTVAVSSGVGGSTVSISPSLALEKIKSGVTSALLDKTLLNSKLSLADSFEVEMGFHEHKHAYRASFYPGAKPLSENSILFKAKDFIDVLKIFVFFMPM